MGIVQGGTKKPATTGPPPPLLPSLLPRTIKKPCFSNFALLDLKTRSASRDGWQAAAPKIFEVVNVVEEVNKTYFRFTGPHCGWGSMHGSAKKVWILKVQFLRRIPAWIAHPSHPRSRLTARLRKCRAAVTTRLKGSNPRTGRRSVTGAVYDFFAAYVFTGCDLAVCYCVLTDYVFARAFPFALAVVLTSASLLHTGFSAPPTQSDVSCSKFVDLFVDAGERSRRSQPDDTTPSTGLSAGPCMAALVMMMQTLLHWLPTKSR